MRKEIEIYDYMNDILKGVKGGVLLTTKSGEEVNTMAIAWGQIGIEWGKLIFTVYVRGGRHTYKMLEENGEYTINIPYKNKAGKIIGYAGTKSGRDTDKIKDLGLTLVDGKEISVPGIKELPLTLECKVLSKQFQDESVVPDDLKPTYYPADVESTHHAANKDYHYIYQGEIVSAYILE